jgi:AcrR family transcriptional regulator
VTDAPKERRREQILQAALEAFAAKGYDGTSMDDIVSISGLSKGTLYWYFESKEELFVMLITKVIRDFGAGFEKLVDALAALPPPERLFKILTASGRVFDETASTEHLGVFANPESAGLYIEFFAQGWKTKAVQKALADTYVIFIDPVVDTLQQGIDEGSFRKVNARAAGMTIVSAIDGLMLQTLLGEEWLFPPNIELLAGIIVRGLLREDRDA